MNKISALLIFSISMLLCSPVPITNRTQLHLIPDSQILALSSEAYNSLLENQEVIRNTPDAQRVEAVGNQIRAATVNFLESKNLSSRLKDYQWEFTLFDDSKANAWAMPGGKTGVNTGILPFTKNDTGLAVVLGHEIAHAIANHGNERMSQALLVELGGLALSEALIKKPEATRQFALAAFGAGAQAGILLPYSRLQEKEADHIGLILMSIAGYNPSSAVDFWQRMMSDNQSMVPELLSTHPSDKNRIKNINKFLPEAQKYYKKNK
jgi:predicted Zn-dependent protease